MSRVPFSIFPPGWVQYTSPSDMPRKWVDEFFECVIDVSASEEEAFLHFLAERGLSLFVCLEGEDKSWRLYWGDVTDAYRGFVLTPSQTVDVCETFWATLDSNRGLTQDRLSFPPDGWLHCATPSDIPQDIVDSFSRIMTSEAFLQFLTKHNLHMLIRPEDNGFRICWDKWDNAGRGFLLTLAQPVDVERYFKASQFRRKVTA